MPIVSTDDEARRLRYIYLGPVGFRFPFDARFPAIGFFLVATVFGVAASFAFSPPGTRLGVLGAVLSPAVAILLTRKVMKHVDHDRPLRWWITAVLNAELDTPRPLTTTTTRAAALPTALTQGTPHEAARTPRTNPSTGGRRRR